MEAATKLADLLRKYVTRSTYQPAQLAQLSGIPKPTIVNWLIGRVKKPRAWQDLIKLAHALHLSEQEVTELLLATGHPSLDELMLLSNEESHRTLLAPWKDALHQKKAKSPFQAIPDLPYFVGREEVLLALKDALLSGRQNRFCSLQGMAGVGKTTVAAHLTYQLRPFFPDGTLWARVDTSNPLAILGTFADAFGRDVSEHTNLADRSRIVRELLADKRVLIVMDNVKTSSQVETLLPPTTGTCAVLITTRRQDLHVTYGMQRFLLGPFDKEKQEALNLFQKILGETRVQRESDIMNEIAELLGHLPLAIAIVANRLAHESGWLTSDILDRLRDEENRIGELVNENQSVQLSFNVSYAALSPDQKQLFAALGTIGGQDFSAWAVAYIIDRTKEDTLDQLRKLIALSIIQPAPAQRYRLHPLLRAYAREQINDNGLWKQMVDYFVHFAQEHERAHERLDMEFGNIEGALQIAFERGMNAPLVQGINSLYLFLESRGLYDMAELYLERAEEVARSTQNTDGLALTLFHLGRLAQQQGNHKQARAHLEAGLALAGESDSLKAIGYRFLGWVMWQQGEYENARSHLEKALALAQTLSMPQIEADSLNNLGITYWYQGDYEQARIYYERAAAIYHQINDRRSESGILINLGSACLKQSDYDQGLHYLEQGLRIAREIGYQEEEGRALIMLGNLFYYQGIYEKAQNHYEQVLDIWRQLGYRRGEGIVLHNLGSVLYDRGSYSQAGAYFEQALHVARQVGNRWSEGEGLYHLAYVHHALGDYVTARTLYEQALNIFQEIRYREGEGEVLSDMGLLLHHLGEDESARDYAKQALGIGEEIGVHRLQSEALTLLGHALVKLTDFTEAMMVYQRALALRHELGQHHLAMEIVAGLARLSFSQDKQIQALEHVETILNHLEAGSLNGTKEPLRVYLTCYQILAADNDPRSETVLATAHHLLQERASRIEDEARRHMFLENVVVHKEIVHVYNDKVVVSRHRS